MTTIDETSGTVADLIDDVTEGLLAHSEWSEIDTDVDNSGEEDGDATHDWRRNGSVVEHNGMGIYLLMYATKYDNEGFECYDFSDFHGVRTVISTDWDTDNHTPAGKTTVVSEDAMSGDVGNHRSDSFTEYDEEARSEAGANWIATDGELGDYDYARNYPVTYFASTRSGGLTVATWNTSSGSYGSASQYVLEHVDEKFWSDGTEPFVVCSAENASGGGHGQFYGFHSYYSERDQNYDTVCETGGALEAGDWGRINSDADDDTFFFRRPVIYSSTSREYPVAYINDAITNHRNEGAAHGDVVTHDDVDYKVFRQSGDGQDNVCSVGLRFE